MYPGIRDEPRYGRPGNLTKSEEKELGNISRNKTPLVMGYDWGIWDIKTVNDFVNDQYNVKFSYSGIMENGVKKTWFFLWKTISKKCLTRPLKVKIFLGETLPEVAKCIEKLVKAGKKNVS